MERKEYVKPEIFEIPVAKNDILAGSDVLINGEELFGED